MEALGEDAYERLPQELEDAKGPQHQEVVDRISHAPFEINQWRDCPR